MHDLDAIVSRYYAAWKDRDRHTLLSLVTPGLEFRSPIDNFDGAEAFLDACLDAFGGMTVNITHRLFGSDEGWIAYEIPGPGGDAQPFAEHLLFEGNRISAIRVYFGARD